MPATIPGHLRKVCQADLARLLKLRGDLGHHAHGCDEGEAREDLRRPLLVHTKPLDLPLACVDCMLHAIGDGVCADGLGSVKLGHSICLHQLLLSLPMPASSEANCSAYNNAHQ